MPNGHGFSFPYGVPLVLYPLLAVGIATGSDKWWGLLFIAVAAVLAGICTWEALSQREFEAVHKNDPTLTRLTWRMNWLLFFALPPALLALFALASLAFL